MGAWVLPGGIQCVEVRGQGSKLRSLQNVALPKEALLWGPLAPLLTTSCRTQ